MKRHCRSCLHYYVKDATVYTYIGFHSLEIGPLGETAKKVERYMGAYTRVQTLFGATSTTTFMPRLTADYISMGPSQEKHIHMDYESETSPVLGEVWRPIVE